MMEYTESQKQIMISMFGSVEEAEKISKLQTAQNYLIQTDYIANKIIEYQFLEKELDKDYTEILQKREEARQVIRNIKDIK